MKKLTINLLTATALLFFIAGCKKDKKEDPPEKTKTEFITQSTWKFDKAETAGGTPLGAFIPPCWLDNTADFVSAAEGSGTGTISEGANVCATSAAGSFTWNFQTNETILFMSTPIIPTGSGSFTIITLNATNMILSQNVTLGAAGTQNVIFTFKH